MKWSPVFIAALAAGTISALPGPASAATSWASISPREEQGRQCIRIGAENLDYYLLDDDQPVLLRVRGPRRVKVVTRYVFGPDDSEEASYRIILRVDGREEVRRVLRADAKAGVGPCGGTGEVAALRKIYLEVPTGLHDIQVLAEADNTGRVAARFFRNSKTREAVLVNFAPEDYDAVYSLQFESGTRSTYYHFTGERPLRFSIIGPTTLEIDTRLDFDHTMTGSSSYQLEVLHNGKPLPRFIYHTKKISAASYVERRDILPGERKKMRLSVPRGRHDYEMRCLGPQNCGVAVRIRIPEADLQ